MAQPPEELDERLWVEIESYPGRSLLAGNAHTHTGRMLAWNESVGVMAKFSKRDVVRASERAEAWIAGFLAGSEPSVLDVADAADTSLETGADREPTDADFDRWRMVVHRYAQTGTLPTIHNSPLPPLPDASLPGPQPWLESACRILVWQQGRWTVEQQFALVGGFAADSVCRQRQHHHLELVSPDYLVCTDCGFVSQIEPRGSA